MARVKETVMPRDCPSAGWYTLSVWSVEVQHVSFRDLHFWTCIRAAFGPRKCKRSSFK